jgi:hypothetical protein
MALLQRLINVTFRQGRLDALPFFLRALQEPRRGQSGASRCETVGVVLARGTADWPRRHRDFERGKTLCSM